MTEPSLNYEAVPLGRPTRTRTAAWISLLVLGILYGIGGTCMGVGAGFSFALLSRAASVPANVKMVLLITGVVMFILGAGMAIAEILLAFRVRKGSRAASIGGLVLTLINVVFILGLLTLGLIGTFMRKEPLDPNVIVGVLVYMVPLAVNAWTAYILSRAIKELNQRSA